MILSLSFIKCDMCISFYYINLIPKIYKIILNEKLINSDIITSNLRLGALIPKFDESNLKIVSRIDNFELTNIIGSGSFGNVYKC